MPPSAPRQTSLDVFERIKRDGTLTRARFVVYAELFDHGPLTGGELDRNLVMPGLRPHFHKRLSELENMGAVARVGRRQCSFTGNVCEVWDVTDTMPTKGLLITPPTMPTPAEAPSLVEEVNERLKQIEAKGAHPSHALLRLQTWLAAGAPRDAAARRIMAPKSAPMPPKNMLPDSGGGPPDVTGEWDSVRAVNADGRQPVEKPEHRQEPKNQRDHHDGGEDVWEGSGHRNVGADHPQKHARNDDDQTDGEQ